jgi:transcriptional regulator with XRE-family HTH domain
LRKQRGLTQSDFDVSHTEIRFLEQGKRTDPQLSTVLKIADALDMTVDELLTALG